MDNETLMLTIEELVRIGFCKPKYYKKTVWKYADKIMRVACKMGYVVPYDFGRGKGKYKGVTTDSYYDISYALVDDTETIAIAEKYIIYKRKC